MKKKEEPTKTQKVKKSDSKKIKLERDWSFGDELSLKVPKDFSDHSYVKQLTRYIPFPIYSALRKSMSEEKQNEIMVFIKNNLEDCKNESIINFLIKCCEVLGDIKTQNKVKMDDRMKKNGVFDKTQELNILFMIEKISIKGLRFEDFSLKRKSRSVVIDQRHTELLILFENFIGILRGLDYLQSSNKKPGVMNHFKYYFGNTKMSWQFKYEKDKTGIFVLFLNELFDFLENANIIKLRTPRRDFILRLAFLCGAFPKLRHDLISVIPHFSTLQKRFTEYTSKGKKVYWKAKQFKYTYSFKDAIGQISLSEKKWHQSFKTSNEWSAERYDSFVFHNAVTVLRDLYKNNIKFRKNIENIERVKVGRKTPTDSYLSLWEG